MSPAVHDLGWASSPLPRLGELRKAQATLDAMIERSVAEARRRGVPWEQIARQLGTTKQGAWKRYRHLSQKANRTQGEERTWNAHTDPRAKAGAVDRAVAGSRRG